MTKCILYIVTGIGVLFAPGCYAGYDTIVPHSVVYTSHMPAVYVRHHGHYRHPASYKNYYNNHYKPHIRHGRRLHRHRHVYRRNVENRTVIHRHYYNSSGKKRRKGKGKKYRRR